MFLAVHPISFNAKSRRRKIGMACAEMVSFIHRASGDGSLEAGRIVMLVSWLMGVLLLTRKPRLVTTCLTATLLLLKLWSTPKLKSGSNNAGMRMESSRSVTRDPEECGTTLAASCANFTYLTPPSELSSSILFSSTSICDTVRRAVGLDGVLEVRGGKRHKYPRPVS